MPYPEHKLLPADIVDRVNRLERKYSAMGQDLRSYLDGLLYADYLTYWDYIHLDVLLSLQTTKTSFEDELIFVTYHQITELYFKLILHAMDQVADVRCNSADRYIEQFKRINSYFAQLVQSFEVMVEGMDKEQFLSFRMSLLPASGFQSAQYRMIEICATDIDNLIAFQHRAGAENWEIPKKYEHLYWKQGATELATKKKTLTLKQFEEKYSDDFIELIEEFQDKNLWQAYKSLPEAEQQDSELIALMRQFDLHANVNWPLMHYKSAVRYLQRSSKDIAATGGTNWQKYLPPKNQFIIFYPELWTEEERDNWGTQAQKELFG